jgi:predicted TPR repeat methyltransferase
VSAQTGYGEWAGHYDATVAAGLDRPLLDAIQGIPWHDIKMAADLACGSDRTGVWLSQHGVRLVDGVDVTPEMLRIAESKNVYRHLRCADVAATLLRIMISAHSFWRTSILPISKLPIWKKLRDCSFPADLWF